MYIHIARMPDSENKIASTLLIQNMINNNVIQCDHLYLQRKKFGLDKPDHDSHANHVERYLVY